MDKHVFKKTSIERVHPEGRGLDYDTAVGISDYFSKNLLSFLHCLFKY